MLPWFSAIVLKTRGCFPPPTRVGVDSRQVLPTASGNLCALIAALTSLRTSIMTVCNKSERLEQLSASGGCPAV